MTNEEAQRLFEDGVQRYEANDFAGALQLLDSLERELPNSRQLIYYRALCLTGLGRTDEALACQQKLQGSIDEKAMQQLSTALANAKYAQQNAVAPETGGNVTAQSKPSLSASLLKCPAELGPVEQFLKQGAYRRAELLLNNYAVHHPDCMVTKRMLAQVYLAPESPSHDPEKALHLIRSVHQTGGAEDPVVTELLAEALAVNGDPKMGLLSLKRLYDATEDAQEKEALTQRIHTFRYKHKMGEVWEFANSNGEVISRTKGAAEAIRAVLRGAIPLDAKCRRNHVGNFESIETMLGPLSPKIVALVKRQKAHGFSPAFLALMFILILGIVAAWFLPDILRMMQ